MEQLFAEMLASYEDGLVKMQALMNQYGNKVSQLNTSKMHAETAIACMKEAGRNMGIYPTPEVVSETVVEPVVEEVPVVPAEPVEAPVEATVPEAPVEEPVVVVEETPAETPVEPVVETTPEP